MKEPIFKNLTEKEDSAIAALIRNNLESFHLDIPGTAYYDEGLEHLSAYYDNPRRAYFVLMEEDTVVGGVGLAELDGMEECCEMQKLYLNDRVKGQGLGYALIRRVEEEAKRLGYRRIYLETHSALEAAVHLYEKCGYRRIDRPKELVHSAMDLFYQKEL